MSRRFGRSVRQDWGREVQIDWRIVPWRLSSILAVLLLPAVAASANISVEILLPSPTWPVDDHVDVSALVTSKYQVSSVVAGLADGAAGSMSFVASSGRWEGTVWVPQFVSGPVTLTVTVTDVQGEVASGSLLLTVDRPPKLTVLEPGPSSLARPGLRIHVKCVDDSPTPCTVKVFLRETSKGRPSTGSEIALWQGETEVDVTTCPYDYDGQMLRVEMSATDGVNAPVEAHAEVIVEMSAALDSVGQVPGALFDADDDRMLFRDPDGGLRSQARAGGEAKYLGAMAASIIFSFPEWRGFGSPDSPATGASLVPAGAVWVSNWQLFAFTALPTGELGKMMSRISPPPVRGRFVAWNDALSGNPTLYDSDKSAVTTFLGGYLLDLTQQGEVLWEDSAGVYLTSTDGGTVQVNDGGYDEVQSALTDGRHFVLVGGGSMWDRTMRVRGPAGEVTIQNVNWDGRYALIALNDGWVAYTKPDGPTQAAVWLVGPDAGETQLTHWGTDSDIEAVSPTGEVAYLNWGRRYLVSVGRDSQDIGGAQGRIFWGDGGWRIIEGNTLFAVLPGGSEVGLEACVPSSEPDAGSSSPPRKPGCGCSTLDPLLPLALLSLPGLAQAVRRRRPSRRVSVSRA